MSSYDIEDLRRTLAAHEDDAPDGLGMMEAVRRNGVRRRRTLRAAQATGITAALAAAALAVPFALDGGNPQDAPAAAGPNNTAPGTIGPILTARPGSGFEVTGQTVGVTKSVVVYSKDNKSATATLYAPGAYDPTRLRQGEPVTVGGKPGFFHPDAGVEGLHPLSSVIQSRPGSAAGAPPDASTATSAPPATTLTVPIVGWEVAPGQWATATFGTDTMKADAVAAAEALVVGPAAPLPTAFRLGHVPVGLAAQQTANGYSSLLAFGTATKPVPGDWTASDFFGAPLTVNGMARNAELDARFTGTGGLPHPGAPTKVGPYDTWYYEAGTPTSPFVIQDKQAGLVVKTDKCWVLVTTNDKSAVPRAELEKVTAAADFKDCSNPATWVAPLN